MAGRPPFVFPANAAQIIELAAYSGSPDREIAALLGCGKGTLTDHFQAVLTKARARRRLDIRSWQMKAAKRGVPALLIWLGKQELGQKELLELDLTDKDLDNMTDDQLAAIAAGRPRLKVSDGGKA